MIRRPLAFCCEGATLFATLDLPEGERATGGLLLVSGGNEIRSGAWGSQAWLAAEAARAGFAVLRFDRRGVGDSEGVNAGFRGSAPDIAAALHAFRVAVPDLQRIVGLGNCDAASALMLAGGAGLDALVLSNPWTIEDEEDGAAEAKAALPAAALRAHYRARLANPAALLRVLTGKVSIGGLVRSVLAMLAPKKPEANALTKAMAAGLAGFAVPVVFPLALRDRTAQMFLAQWDAKDARIARCEGATHSFVEPHAREWYLAQILSALRQ